jgi:Flp pilus assembly pilin Flp
MVYLMSCAISQKMLVLAKQFLREERGDEIIEKAAVIGAITVAVVVIIALAALAAAALNKGAGWFGG